MLVFFQPRKTLEVNLREPYFVIGEEIQVEDLPPSMLATGMKEVLERRFCICGFLGLRWPTSNGMNTLTGASGFRVGMY